MNESKLKEDRAEYHASKRRVPNARGDDGAGEEQDTSDDIGELDQVHLGRKARVSLTPGPDLPFKILFSPDPVRVKSLDSQKPKSISKLMSDLSARCSGGQRLHFLIMHSMSETHDAVRPTQNPTPSL